MTTQIVMIAFCGEQLLCQLQISYPDSELNGILLIVQLQRTAI